jgi:hypothetical protein
MNVPPPLPLVPVQRKLDHASVWQLVLGAVSLVLSTLFAVGLVIIFAVSKSTPAQKSVSLSQISYFYWILGLLLLFSIGSLISAILSLSGHSPKEIIVGKRQALIMLFAMLLWGGLLYVGQNITAWKLPSWLISPLDVLVVAIPILMILTLGLYQLTAGSRQRSWALTNVTSFVSTQIMILLEFIVIIVAIVIAFGWLSKQVDLTPYLSIFNGKSSIDQSELQSLVNKLSPFVQNSDIYAAVALIFCVFVPLIEELFKPLGVWFLAGKKLTPAQGFAAGLICGATFGLIESISMINMADSGAWLSIAVARVGTGLLHTLSAGMSGWALAKTWQDNHYIRVALTYCGVVLLHGLWNFFAVLMGLSSMPIPIRSNLLTVLMNNSTWVLLGITVCMLLLLLWMNLNLRKKLTPPELPVFSDKLNDSLE